MTRSACRATLASVTVLAAVAACTAATPSSVQPTAPAPRALNATQAFEEICEGSAALPLEVHGSRHFVRVTLTGPRETECVRFHVDTGGNTPGITLSRSVARRLGFTDESAMPRSLIIGATRLPLPAGARWLLLDDSEDKLRKGFSVGQLGAGFLSRYLVCLDPARGRLGLASASSLTIAPDDSSIPLILQPGGSNRALYPFVFARVGEHDFGLLLDTGATTSMLESRPMAALHERNPRWPFARGAAGDSDMIGGAFPEHVLEASGVVLTFPRAPMSLLRLKRVRSLPVGRALFVERPDGTWESMFGPVRHVGAPAGALANDVLNRYRMLIDYRSARLWLEPTGRAPEPSASMVRVGVAIELARDGCPVVRQINDHNAPEVRDQLRPGDVLLAVDGRDLCPLEHHAIARELGGRVGQLKGLRVRRGAETIRLRLPVADLLSRE